jgi:hypothetical protein
MSPCQPEREGGRETTGKRVAHCKAGTQVCCKEGSQVPCVMTPVEPVREWAMTPIQHKHTYLNPVEHT